MTPAAYIRKSVLGFKSQQAFADAVGVEQATVSRWEADGFIPTPAQHRVREMCITKLGAGWQDLWFFEVPPAAVIAPAFEQAGAGA